MADPNIRRELARSVITEPLLSKTTNPTGKLLKVIIDVNLDYYRGREESFAAVREIAEHALRTIPPAAAALVGIELPSSIGSSNNPFMSARLPDFAIVRMVEIDEQRAVEELAQRMPTESGEPAAPTKLRPYRAIYRLWENFQVRPLIDRSCATVKADAARRAFLAEGAGVVWAVVDSGIDGRHEHFQDHCNLQVELPLRHYDFTVPANDGSTALVDEFGHGTHVAGIIAGGLKKARPAVAVRSRMTPSGDIEEETETIQSIMGMAPCCKLISMKVLDATGDGDVARILAAIDAVQQINDHGRRILIHGMNLSLGYEFDPKWFACGQSPVCVEVERLVRSGVVVVVAAGNTGYGTAAAMPRATAAGFVVTINDPGNAELAITVGSTHRDMPHTYGVSYFSSKGPTGDGRPKPDLVAPGERILSCNSTHGMAGAAANEYKEDSGTSMAAPHVAGAIAAFLSIRREYIGQPEKVKRLFMESATDLNRDRSFQGRGLVDLMRAIQSV